MSDAIAVRNVTKAFGKNVAVRDLDLTVATGSLCGFIGPNGAGKTTTIRMIMSIMLPDAGEISVLGCASALDAKDRIGYLPEERGIYKKMKVSSFLTHIGRLKGVPDGVLRERVKSWLNAVELDGVANKKCEELSKGMQQKIQFITCVLHEPDLLILDEPFSGLDPVNMRLVRDLILREHERGTTIIFSTHVMAQAEALCDRIVMIDQGSKVLDESVAQIRAEYDPRVVNFAPLDPESDVAALSRLPGIGAVEHESGEWKIHLADTSEPSAVIREIVAQVPPARIELHRPSLEDIFVQIVRESAAGQDARS
jgi:ABC-2 type transport system ATP-binding protein